MSHFEFSYEVIASALTQFPHADCFPIDLRLISMWLTSEATLSKLLMLPEKNSGEPLMESSSALLPFLLHDRISVSTLTRSWSDSLRRSRRMIGELVDLSGCRELIFFVRLQHIFYHFIAVGNKQMLSLSA
jgi:hypothetical protein